MVFKCPTCYTQAALHPLFQIVSLGFAFEYLILDFTNNIWLDFLWLDLIIKSLSILGLTSSVVRTILSTEEK